MNVVLIVAAIWAAVVVAMAVLVYRAKRGSGAAYEDWFDDETNTPVGFDEGDDS